MLSFPVLQYEKKNMSTKHFAAEETEKSEFSKPLCNVSAIIRYVPNALLSEVHSLNYLLRRCYL